MIPNLKDIMKIPEITYIKHPECDKYKDGCWGNCDQFYIDGIFAFMEFVNQRNTQWLQSCFLTFFVFCHTAQLVGS